MGRRTYYGEVSMLPHATLRSVCVRAIGMSLGLVLTPSAGWSAEKVLPALRPDPAVEKVLAGLDDNTAARDISGQTPLKLAAKYAETTPSSPETSAEHLAINAQ